MSKEYNLMAQLCVWLKEIETEIKYNDENDLSGEYESTPLAPHFDDFCDEIVPTQKTFRKHETKLLNHLNQILTYCEEVLSCCENLFGQSVRIDSNDLEAHFSNKEEIRVVRVVRQQLESDNQSNRVVRSSRVKLGYHITAKICQVVKTLNNCARRSKESSETKKLHSLSFKLNKQVIKLKSLTQLLNDVLISEPKSFSFETESFQDSCNSGHTSTEIANVLWA
eukprot:gb/GECH01011904.1/.p1 GENE.gb/GECH01011904.1/~~gb/GECH01011904.1/.p1  ORF type:complete len:224 (+),score=28.22 gb/GECH01011904.1/:1-672(+)